MQFPRQDLAKCQRRRLVEVGLAALVLAGAEALRPPAFEPSKRCLNATSMVADRGSLRPLVGQAPSGGASQESPPEKVTLFWTIGPGHMTQEVVQEQARVLMVSGLLDFASDVFVNTFDYDRQADAAPWQNLFVPRPHVAAMKPVVAQALRTLANMTAPIALDAESVTQYQRHLVPSFEFPTLEALWQHCQREPDDTVAYFHTKGSGMASAHLAGNKARNADSRRLYWRQVLNTFALERWRECARSLQCGFDTCGPLLQYGRRNVMWPHYSGNFFWASCRYVATRQTPQPTREELQAVGFEGDRPFGRYLAESWLLDQHLPVTANATFYHRSMYGTPEGFLDRTTAANRESTSDCAKPFARARY